MKKETNKINNKRHDMKKEKQKKKRHADCPSPTLA